MSNDPMNTPEPERHSQREFTSEGSRVRRRRTRGLDVPADAEGQAELLTSLSRRAHPSFELFIYALLSGAIIGLGFWLDAPAVLFLGVLLTPLLTPWVGFLLAFVAGSLKYLFETFMAFMISAVIVLLIGVLTGFASQLFADRTLDNAFYFARLWVPQLIVVVLGAILLTASFVRSESKPFLPSLAVAFTFYLPLSAAGFGLGAGVPGLWPQGVLVFFVHFGLASIFGLLTLFALRIRPSTSGMLLTGGAVLILAISVGIILFAGSDPSVENEAPTPIVVVESTPTLPAPDLSLVLPSSTNPAPILVSPQSSAEATFTFTPVMPTPVPLTLTITLPVTETPTITLTIEPTPVYAKINAPEGGGANLRNTPNGRFVATLDNGTLVQILPDILEVNSVTWIHVIAPKNGVYLEGWVLQSVLNTATPLPNWEISPTP